MLSNETLSLDSSSTSSLSQTPPPPFPLLLVAFSLYVCCSLLCMRVCYFVSMLQEDKKNWISLTRACLYLTSRVFRRWCFVRFCVFYYFGANIWVSKILVHSWLIARKLIASICPPTKDLKVDPCDLSRKFLEAKIFGKISVKEKKYVSKDIIRVKIRLQCRHISSEYLSAQLMSV